MRKTKIICTIGPASNNPETVRELIRSGMNVARLNFSHGDHAYHQNSIDLIKQAREELNAPVAILLDTKGPEIRLGNFKNGAVKLKKGADFTLTAEKIEGDETRCSVTYEDLPMQLKPGNRVLLDDGRLRLEVTAVQGKEITCKVLVGGEISNHKGVNIPNIHLDLKYISEADAKDLIFGIENDVDFVAASFVRCKEDLIDLRKFLDYHAATTFALLLK